MNSVYVHIHIVERLAVFALEQILPHTLLCVKYTDPVPGKVVSLLTQNFVKQIKIVTLHYAIKEIWACIVSIV